MPNFHDETARYDFSYHHLQLNNIRLNVIIDTIRESTKFI